jgi:molybdopterin-guanine dinucleotide biosynthesis protein A
MVKFPQIEGFILAGGMSSRMGRDKALLEIGGKTLVERAARLCESLVANITFVGDPQRYSGFGFPTLADRWPGAGPLGAIATALGAAHQPWCLVLACDMPFVTGSWLDWLLSRVTKSSADAAAPRSPIPDAFALDAFIPYTNRGLEPLCAAYRAGRAPALAAAVDSGIRKVTDGLAHLNTEIIGENAWRKFSPDGDLFQNMNTWEDYLSAKKHLES